MRLKPYRTVDQAAHGGTTRTPERVAMQKVEGSSPFVRFAKPRANAGLALSENVAANSG